MVGKSSTAVAAVAAIALQFSILPAASEVVSGQSRELGIRFEVRGGKTWCNSDVSVSLFAEKATAFQLDARSFVQMVGRIRAIILDQCENCERIIFEGMARNTVAKTFEMSRLTGWRHLIELHPIALAPLCSDTNLAAECSKRSEAYTIARAILRGPQFGDAEATVFLDTHNPVQFAWTSKEVVGKLTLADKTNYAAQFEGVSPFADAVLESLRTACVTTGGLTDQGWAENYSDTIVVRGFQCRPATGAAQNNIIAIRSAEAHFQVFSLFAENDVGDAAAAIGRALAFSMQPQETVDHRSSEKIDSEIKGLQESIKRLEQQTGN